MTIIDVHTHMYSNEWVRLLKDRAAPLYTMRNEAHGPTIFDGDAVVAIARPEHLDYELRIKAMDRYGIDMAVVSLTCPNVYWGGRDVSLLAAQLVNDEMAAAQTTWPDRIRWFTSLPWEYPDLAVAELERSHKAGASGVMVLANIAGKSLTDPMFTPIWDKIDALALPVLVHPTTPPGARAMDLGSYDLSWNTGFAFDTTLAVGRLILDGFLDRYQKLRIIASHGGAALPWLIGRFDRGWEIATLDDQKALEKPSTYLSRIAYDSITYSHEALKYLIDIAGIDQVMFGTDFPHIVGDFDGKLAGVERLAEPNRDAVRHRNARRIFGL